MKEIWKVPEKWCVKVTTIEQDKTLVDYINEKFYSKDDVLTYGTSKGYCYFSNEKISANEEEYYNMFYPPEDPTIIEITYEQFVDYILNPIIEEPVVIKDDLTYLNTFLNDINIT